jgi:hypothetical protein
MKRMRLAIQISGEFRTLDKAIECLKKNVYSSFRKWDIDIFVHTWRREDDISGGPQTAVQVSSHGVGLARLQPRSYYLETYEDRAELHALPRAYSMFYSIQRANEARKEYERLTETSYDLVMRYRTDCYLDGNLYEFVKPYVTKPRTSFLCIPKTVRGTPCDGPVDGEEGSLCDWFAIGTPDAIDIYCSTFDTFRTLGLPILPESMVSLQLEANGITEQTILKRPPFDFYLVKGDAFKQSLKTPHGLEER